MTSGSVHACKKNSLSISCSRTETIKNDATKQYCREIIVWTGCMQEIHPFALLKETYVITCINLIQYRVTGCRYSQLSQDKRWRKPWTGCQFVTWADRERQAILHSYQQPFLESPRRGRTFQLHTETPWRGFEARILLLWVNSVIATAPPCCPCSCTCHKTRSLIGLILRCSLSQFHVAFILNSRQK